MVELYMQPSCDLQPKWRFANVVVVTRVGRGCFLRAPPESRSCLALQRLILITGNRLVKASSLFLLSCMMGGVSAHVLSVFTGGHAAASEPMIIDSMVSPTITKEDQVINIHSEIPYSKTKLSHQTLDLYLPEGPGPFPVTVCYFGGAFVIGDKQSMAEVCRFLAAHGIAAAAPGYYLTDTLSGRAAWPRNINDAKCAVRFLKEHAGEYHLDPEKVAVLGHSSGAYLALLVGFTPHLPQLEGDGGWHEQSSRVAAVVDISGVCDRRGDEGMGTKYLLGRGFAKNPELRKLASPIVHIGQNTPPVYLLHGSRDPVVPIASSRQLADALQKAGVSHRLHIVPEADHDPITPETLKSVTTWLLKQFDQVTSFESEPGNSKDQQSDQR